MLIPIRKTLKNSDWHPCACVCIDTIVDRLPGSSAGKLCLYYIYLNTHLCYVSIFALCY